MSDTLLSFSICENVHVFSLGSIPQGNSADATGPPWTSSDRPQSTVRVAIMRKLVNHLNSFPDNSENCMGMNTILWGKWDPSESPQYSSTSSFFCVFSYCFPHEYRRQWSWGYILETTHWGRGCSHWVASRKVQRKEPHFFYYHLNRIVWEI